MDTFEEYKFALLYRLRSQTLGIESIVELAVWSIGMFTIFIGGERACTQLIQTQSVILLQVAKNFETLVETKKFCMAVKVKKKLALEFIRTHSHPIRKTKR